jgi:hypothetical protein
MKQNAPAGCYHPAEKWADDNIPFEQEVSIGCRESTASDGIFFPYVNFHADKRRQNQFLL